MVWLKICAICQCKCFAQHKNSSKDPPCHGIYGRRDRAGRTKHATVKQLAQAADELTDQAENLTRQVERFTIPHDPEPILQTHQQDAQSALPSQQPQQVRLLKKCKKFLLFSLVNYLT